MGNETVEHFAIGLDMQPQALLNLLNSAGVVKESLKDRVSDADKKQLRDHLIKTRTSMGVVSPRKLTRLSATESPKQPLHTGESVNRNLKSIQLQTQTQLEFDTPADTDIN